MHQVLRGDPSKLLWEDDQPPPQPIDCSSDIGWGRGEFYCLFVHHNSETGRYVLAEPDAGAQAMPFLRVAQVDELGEVIGLWDTTFARKSADERLAYAQTAPKRDQLVYTIVAGANNRQEMTQALEALRLND